MRFYEFNHIKHIKPLSPPEARMYKLKRTAELARGAVETEKEAQKRQKALDKQRKDLGRGRPTNNPNQTL